jgi:hypothetical protein
VRRTLILQQLKPFLSGPNLLAHENSIGYGKEDHGDGDQRNEVGKDNVNTFG